MRIALLPASMTAKIEGTNVSVNRVGTVRSTGLANVANFYFRLTAPPDSGDDISASWV